MDENNKENNLTGDDINLDQEDNIIDDAECPKCHKVVADKAEFCSCGFYYKSYKRARMYLFIVILIALIAFIGFLLSCFGVFAKIEKGVATKISQEDMFSSTSPVMQVENNLKNTGIEKHISKIYPKDIYKQNILIVFINPEDWETMADKKKVYIYNTISKLWKKAYKGEDPIVKFANPGFNLTQ